MKAKVSGRYNKMFNAQKIGKHLSEALCAVLFGSTLILSAVGPAQASEAPKDAANCNPVAVYYLA